MALTDYQVRQYAEIVIEDLAEGADLTRVREVLIEEDLSQDDLVRVRDAVYKAEVTVSWP